MTLLSPKDAAMPAHEEAAFPVLAQAMILWRFSRAFTTPLALARACREPVALRSSSFRKRVRRPTWRAREVARVNGVHPTARAGKTASSRIGSNSRYLHRDLSGRPASVRRLRIRAIRA